MRRLAVFGVLLVLLVSACSGGGGKGSSKSIAASELSRLVLQPGDVSASFKRSSTHAGTSANRPSGKQGSAAARVGAWESKFKRVSFAGPGPYVIVSRAELFKTANVATKQLDDFRSVIQQSPRFAGHGVRMSAPDVGEEAIAITALQGKGARTLRFVSVIWRDRNVMASLSGNGFAQTMSVDDVLALARSQDRHIHDA